MAYSAPSFATGRAAADIKPPALCESAKWKLYPYIFPGALQTIRPCLDACREPLSCTIRKITSARSSGARRNLVSAADIAGQRACPAFLATPILIGGPATDNEARKWPTHISHTAIQKTTGLGKFYGSRGLALPASYRRVCPLCLHGSLLNRDLMQ